MWKTPGLFHPPRSGFSLERRNCTSGVQLQETSGSWSQRPRALPTWGHGDSGGRRRKLRRRPQSRWGKDVFSHPDRARKEAGNLPALQEFHLNLPEAWSGEEGGQRRTCMQARPGVQKNRGRGIVNSSTHRPIAPRAADTPFPSLSHSFLVCKILIPAAQGEGTCVHWMRPLVKPLSLIIAFTLCSLGRQEISSQ